VLYTTARRVRRYTYIASFAIRIIAGFNALFLGELGLGLLKFPPSTTTAKTGGASTSGTLTTVAFADASAATAAAFATLAWIAGAGRANATFAWVAGAFGTGHDGRLASCRKIKDLVRSYKKEEAA